MSEAIYQKVADEWGGTIRQVEAFKDLIDQRGGTMVGDLYEDLTLAAIAYSEACARHECAGWLPFDLMPNWEADVYCILEDEGRWNAAMESNESILDLADRLKKETA
jgi:hypothetical protein